MSEEGSDGREEVEKERGEGETDRVRGKRGTRRAENRYIKREIGLGAEGLIGFRSQINAGRL